MGGGSLRLPHRWFRGPKFSLNDPRTVYKTDHQTVPQTESLGVPCACSGLCLFWARSLLALGSLCAHSGLALGSVWALAGFALVWLCARSGLALSSVWARSGLAMGTLWTRSKLALARFGHALGSLWARFGLALQRAGSLGCRSPCQVLGHRKKLMSLIAAVHSSRGDLNSAPDRSDAGPSKTEVPSEMVVRDPDVPSCSVCDRSFWSSDIPGDILWVYSGVLAACVV